MFVVVLRGNTEKKGHIIFLKQKAKVLKTRNSKLGVWQNNIYWVNNNETTKNYIRKCSLNQHRALF